MKYNLYNLLHDLLEEDYSDYAEKHMELCNMILDEEDHNELEDELYDFWKTLEA